MGMDYSKVDTVTFMVAVETKEKLATYVRHHNSSINQWILTNFGQDILDRIEAAWASLPEAAKKAGPRKKMAPLGIKAPEPKHQRPSPAV